MTNYNPTDLLVLSDLLHEVCDNIYYTDLDFALVTRDEEKAKELTLLCDKIFNEACDLYLDYEEAVNPLIEDYDNLFSSNANKKALMRKHRKGNALHKSADHQHGKNWYKRNGIRSYEDVIFKFREIPKIPNISEMDCYNGLWYSTSKGVPSPWKGKTKYTRNRKTFRDKQNAAYKDRISEYK